MKIELEISKALNDQVAIAAKNLKMSKKKLMIQSIRRVARENQESREELAASIKRFFEENPDCCGGWWEDRGWDNYLMDQPKLPLET